MIYRSLAPLGLVILLAGCDAWPTVVDNQAPRDIAFRYYEAGEIDWSAKFDLPKARAQRLAREHWIQDIKKLEIREGQQTYRYSSATLSKLSAGCPSTELARRLKLAKDCYVTYTGDGRLRSSFSEPKNLVWVEWMKGS